MKTVIWSDCKDVLADQAKRRLGAPCYKKKVENFVEFISSYPTITKKKICAFFNDVVMKPSLKDETEVVVASEDSCLCVKMIVSSVDIIVRYLNILNTGGKINSLWCYLDRDKEAVVHFVNKCGWYAEGYFSCSKNFSALHFIREDSNAEFIPVVFSTDMSKVFQNVALNGGHFLQDYLPRDIGDFIPKNKSRGDKSNNSDSSKERVGYDKGDML